MLCHLWYVLLAGWVILLIVTWRAAPPWDEVAQDKEFAFLPPGSPSLRAEEIYKKAFPEDRLTSNVVLVLDKTDNEPLSFDENLKFINDVLVPGLRKIADADGGLASEITPSTGPLFGNPNESTPQQPQQRSIMDRILTPDIPGTGAFLVSQDRRALLVVVELTTEFLAGENKPIIAKIEDLVRELQRQNKAPAGVNISVTGSAVIGRDHTQAELQSVRATQLLTVVLVIGLLIAIYRAPVLALIPLVTVYIAVQISVNCLSIFAKAGYMTMFQGIQIYITILAYGAGVDYCLFLIARYREELERGESPTCAIGTAIGNVGHALTASAAAVICGIGMLYFAQFGKFREAGLAIPFSLLIVLCATLTFSPSLLRLAGTLAFWPRHPLEKTAEKPDGPTGSERQQGFGQSRWLEGLWDRVGQVLLRRPAAVWLITVALMAPFAIVAVFFYNWLSYDLIGELPTSSPSVTGTHIMEKHFPAGIMGPITILLIDKGVDFSSDQGRKIVSRVTDQLDENKETLGLSDVRSLTAPLGITKSAERNPFTGLHLSEETVRDITHRAAKEHYITDLEERAKIGTRLELILKQTPFSERSIVDLDRVENTVRVALPASERERAQFYFAGVTSSIRDLSTVIQQDRTRIQLLVMTSVFVILVILLREIIIPVYLLLSVLFSYFTTLGVTFVVCWLLDPQGFNGIDWKVAIFLFTILIAVGADYNIFLMTRIHEEEVRHGPILGITQALDRTGPIISSCGIIMAGTFASLLAGSLVDMRQLGFALAFGVLLDTFVVRPILVPAFLILWRRGRLHRAEQMQRNPEERAEIFGS